MLAATFLSSPWFQIPKIDLGLDHLKQYHNRVDWAIACETAEGVQFWMKTMLFGLIVHLPAAMTAWHLVHRYTTLMQVKDVLAGRVPKPSTGSWTPRARRCLQASASTRT